jgi:hypothetical protein
MLDLSLAAVPPGLIFPGLHPSIQSLFFRRVGSPSPVRVLHIHSGAGIWLEVLEKKVGAKFELYGIEANLRLFEQSRKKLNSALVFCCSPLEQDFPKGFFDLIHLEITNPGEDLGLLLQRVRYFLVEGGSLLLNYHDPVDFPDYCLYRWFPSLKPHHLAPRYPSVVRALEKNNFSLIWTGAHPVDLPTETLLDLPRRLRAHLRACGLNKEDPTLSSGFEAFGQVINRADPADWTPSSMGLRYREVLGLAGSLPPSTNPFLG